MQQARNAADHAQRALTARSVVASLLLGMRHPHLTAARLVRVGGVFGFSEGTTRVALSRMVAAGELVADGGEYGLAGPLAERHGRQEEGRHPSSRPWDGTWLVAVLGAAGGRRDASQRAASRRILASARMAEWREGVWVRPDNLDGATRVSGCTWWTGARPVAPPDGPGVAASLWDLGGWADTARALRASMADTSPSEGIPASFGVAAAVVRHLRDDPLLPAELLPPAWPGDLLRRDYDAYEAAFQIALRPVLVG